MFPGAVTEANETLWGFPVVPGGASVYDENVLIGYDYGLEPAPRENIPPSDTDVYPLFLFLSFSSSSSCC